MCLGNWLQPLPQINFQKVAFFRFPLIAKRCAGDEIELVIVIKLLSYYMLCVIYRKYIMIDQKKYIHFLKMYIERPSKRKAIQKWAGIAVKSEENQEQYKKTLSLN